MSFEFKKKYGQNFLTDKNLLSSIVKDASIESQDEVLEIGAGMGALTQEIAKVAKKVVAFEIDESLKPYLENLNLKNVDFIFADALKTDMTAIENNFSGNFKLVANLPYYITSPLIFKFLKESEKITSLSIMVQEEVGRRICAEAGSSDYGALSVSCQFFGKPRIMRKVGRKMFTPSPDVDSCIVRLDITRREDVDATKFLSLVKMAFKSRRKTLLNNLAEGLGVSKSSLSKIEILQRRAEQLSVDEFVSLAQSLQQSL